MAKIFIGIPCYQNVAGETLEDYMRFAYYLGRRYTEHDFFLGIKTKSEQFRARNSLVDAAQQVNADYLLMLDDDHIIDIDESGVPSERYEFLRKLLEHDKDIIGPLYYQRGGDCQPVLMREEGGGYYWLTDNDIQGGLQEVSVQGGGCMLIKMRVFDKIKQPYFAPEHQFGTDIQLCKAAAEKGFKIFSDTSIVLGHIMNKRIIVSDKNKDSLKEVSQQNQLSSMAQGWQANSIMMQYKDDAMRYLGIKSELELADLYNEYAYKAEALSQGDSNPPQEDYYRNIGRPQLARQVLFHLSENARVWDNYCLQVINVRASSKAIDFGCGSAPIGFHFLRKGHEIFFHDLDGAVAFEFLKWRAKEYGMNGRAHFNEWPESRSVDYIMLNDILEHLEDWTQTMERLEACLKNYGFIVTNYVAMTDWDNPEHINRNRGDWVKWCIEHHIKPIGDAIWQLRLPR